MRKKQLIALGGVVFLTAAGLWWRPAWERYEVHRELSRWFKKFPPQPAPVGLEAVRVLPSILTTNLTLDSGGSPYYIPGSLTVARGTILTLRPGVELVFGVKASLVIRGSLQAEGTLSSPVQMRAAVASNLWAGLLLVAAEAPSLLRHVRLANAHYGFRSFRSTLVVDSCGMLNLKEVCAAAKSHTTVTNCNIAFKDFPWHSNINVFKFYKGHAVIVDSVVRCPQTDLKVDAFDVDHVESGLFRGNRFFGSECQGADGIDVGLQSRNVLIADNLIEGFEDKGISVGEGAQVVITNNVVMGCGQGIGIKDQGEAAIDRCTFLSNGVAIACFEKTPGQGGGKALARGCIIAFSGHAPVKIDALSSLLVQNSICDTAPLSGEGNVQADLQFEPPGDGRATPNLRLTRAKEKDRPTLNLEVYGARVTR